jgi:hypothetical protein
MADIGTNADRERERSWHGVLIREGSEVRNFGVGAFLTSLGHAGRGCGHAKSSGYFRAVHFTTSLHH